MVGFGGLCMILAMLLMPHVQTKYENCGRQVGLPRAFGWRKAESISSQGFLSLTGQVLDKKTGNSSILDTHANIIHI